MEARRHETRFVLTPESSSTVRSRFNSFLFATVHLPSCTVYRNWPTSNTPLGRISSVAISPNSDMLAVGNEQGRIRLWEIRG